MKINADDYQTIRAKSLCLKLVLSFSIFLTFISMNAQVEPLFIYDWTLDKVVIDGEETLAEANYYGDWVDITFMSYEETYYFMFDDVGSNIILNETNQSFTIIEDTFWMTLGGDHGTLAASRVKNPLLYSTEYDSNSNTSFYNFKHPFEFEFTIEGDLIFLDITNSDGDVASFWATSLSDINFKEASFSIFPNPVAEILHIKNEQAQIEKVEIYDLNGKQVLVDVNYLKNQHIDVSSLVTGFYFLKIETEKGVVTKKFIKK